MIKPAVKRIFLAALIALIAVLPESGLAEDFDDCVLKNATGEKSETQLKLIERACLERTTPKRCRRCLPHNARFHNDCNLSDFGKKLFGLEDDSNIDEQVRKQWMNHCIEECEQAGFWERHFGDCATG
jgi:recombinational DNA repair protein (RecF pathway)